MPLEVSWSQLPVILPPPVQWILVPMDHAPPITLVRQACHKKQVPSWGARTDNDAYGGRMYFISFIQM